MQHLPYSHRSLYICHHYFTAFVIGSLIEFAGVHYFTKIGYGEVFDYSYQLEKESETDRYHENGVSYNVSLHTYSHYHMLKYSQKEEFRGQ